MIKGFKMKLYEGQEAEYEKVKISWNERGKTYIIDCDGKKVSMTSGENTANVIPETKESA